ncbi:hypothetical protein PsorP6_014462 [Peronosclerospora sorghi]|uniref:Uncharacterized protein n=1 Tax=Peronosclerospora sorghi TaxID=230839 RepID=A0ACC0VT06_9STRA|nr:hypothetical protein PsorP6_014462 [Peronosclerospora sorghi]
MLGFRLNNNDHRIGNVIDQILRTEIDLFIFMVCNSSLYSPVLAIVLSVRTLIALALPPIIYFDRGDRTKVVYESVPPTAANRAHRALLAPE